MAKQRPSLEAFAKAGNELQPGAFIDPETRQSVVTNRELKQETAPQVRQDRPHTTLYLEKKVQRVIKEIALQYDRKVHDLYIEGINLMLTRYGRPSIDELMEK